MKLLTMSEMAWRFAVSVTILLVCGTMTLMVWCLAAILGLPWLIIKAWRSFIRHQVKQDLEDAFLSGYWKGLGHMAEPPRLKRMPALGLSRKAVAEIDEILERKERINGN